MGSMIESRGKRLHDRLCYSEQNNKMIAGKCFWVPGAVIVGAGPSGLAVAACLKDRGVPSEIIERDNCIASLWQHKTYDRLRLHLPKQFCELPLMPFPSNFPTYPTKQQFISYLESYAQRFDIRPRFNERVDYAAYDQNLGLWRLRTLRTKDKNDNEVEETEYVCRWMVVATGENAEEVIPKIEGTDDFLGPVIHSSSYKTGESFYGKRVLVVGCGNSGMEVCFDLCNYNARPSLVVREALHILPREMLGRSTFGLSMWLLKWLPIRWVDRFLLFISRFMLGDTTPFGLVRPSIGPLELKNRTGKTPVLDVGTLTKIRNGDIKIYPAIKKVMRHGVEFVDERVEAFDAIVFATGYRSNVPTWLKEKEMFSEIDGLPKKPFPNGWKGRCGLYAVGFTKRGLLGASVDARRIALDIESSWKADAKHLSHSKPLFTSCHS